MKKITLLMLIVFTMTTHAQNKLLSSIYESYFNNAWSVSSGNNYVYDSNNNLTAETYLSWDSSNNAWKISSKSTYTYNASNKVTEEIYQSSWNTPNNTLENTWKTTYTYAAGRLTESVGYNWENANWVLNYKLVITYNANNLLDSYINYSWDGTQWVNDERYTFTYNANNKVASDIGEEWASSQWVNKYKSLYNYNSNNKIISQIRADWDVFNSMWVANGNKTEYEWDAAGNRTQEVEYSTTNIGTLNQYKSEYTYDTFNLMTNFAHPFKDKTGLDYFFNEFPYVNKVQGENSYSYNAQTSSFNLNGRTTYNYNAAIALSTPTIDKATANITFYPNPTTDFLNIQNPSKVAIDKVFVTDLTGKKVLEQNNANQVNVANLAKGLYVVEAFSGEEKWVIKFVKE